MYQKVILIGFLGRDPELRYTSGGKAVVNMSVATTTYWYDNNHQKQSKTEWHRVIGWDKTAENCQEYLRKGSLVHIEGRLQTRTWEKDGQNHYITEIVIKEFNILDRKQTDQNGTQGNYQKNAASVNNKSQQQYTDDDIPF